MIPSQRIIDNSQSPTTYHPDIQWPSCSAYGQMGTGSAFRSLKLRLIRGSSEIAADWVEIFNCRLHKIGHVHDMQDAWISKLLWYSRL
ncbi:hypothetical protein PG988_009083 [Apiospora saccharicola]